MQNQWQVLKMWLHGLENSLSLIQIMSSSKALDLEENLTMLRVNFYVWIWQNRSSGLFVLTYFPGSPRSRAKIAFKQESIVCFHLIRNTFFN